MVTNLKLKIASFYQSNIPKIVPKYQNLVFQKFGLRLEQIISAEKHSHSIDSYVSKTDFNYIIIFDIDAIPVTPKCVDEIINKIVDGKTLFGVAQQSNHLEPRNHPYAGPACLGLSRNLYEALGRPSFRETHRSDCGEELTWIAEEKGFRVHLEWPTHVIQPKWALGNNAIFGIGTTYGDMIFHTFEMGLHPWKHSRIFAKKCKQVLGERITLWERLLIPT
jgi:hypothetical protein